MRRPSLHPQGQRSLNMQVIVTFFVCIGFIIAAYTLFIDNN